MRNFILLFLFLLGFSGSLPCAASVGAINSPDERPEIDFVVWMHDGAKVAYRLSEHPVVTYCDGELLLETHQQKVSYVADDVHKFTFSTGEEQEQPSTGVDSVCLEQHVSMKQGDILFSGCGVGECVYVYTMDGKLMQTVKVDESGRAFIPFSSYSAGAYIIKTETITHKIIKR